ncbi:DUF84 family protein [Tuberibacillus sp. Marseille-P3662]|uniref:DUF84 family protein n=1 Tax=Tuberibacillus sp. Marseille-P3662 TaxID=1965358 RepID=UPI000A1CA429|nr:DUF84 family protein [Tuberibacillus sp. Marseille-P3662]
MTTLAIGTKNPAKVKAVTRYAESHSMTVHPVNVDSGVSNQPMNDAETLTGATNRAMGARQANGNDFGIGLEGGVMTVGRTMYLCSWGALTDQDDNIVTASGARVTLPETLSTGIQKGYELGDIIDDFAQQKNIKQNEGTIGVLTNNLIKRDHVFFEIVQILFAQYKYPIRD